MLRQESEVLIENQIKLITERIKNTEKYSAQLRAVFANISHREAELRDSYDELSKICKDLAETETLDLSLVTALHAISNTFTMLADNKNIEAQRLVVHIESEFAQYGSICKKLKETLKECNKDPIVSMRQKRAGEMPTMESKLIKANVDTKRILNELSDTFETFEQRKIQDFKSILQHLLLILMKANTSSIDPLTYSIKSVLEVDETLDLKKIKESFHKLNAHKKERQKRFRSRSMSALSSIFKGGKKPILSQSSTSINSSEIPTLRQTGRQHLELSDNDDDEEEDQSQSETESSLSTELEDRTKGRNEKISKIKH